LFLCDSLDPTIEAVFVPGDGVRQLVLMPPSVIPAQQHLSDSQPVSDSRIQAEKPEDSSKLSQPKETI
jgi:hypothetical protein